MRTSQVRAKRKLQQTSAQPHLISISEALNDYIESLFLEQKSSAREAASLANKLLGKGSFAQRARFSLPETMPVAELTAAHLMELRAARRREGNAVQTIAHELKNLRAALFHAAAWGHAIPALHWRIPSAKQKTRYLSGEEWRRIYDELDPDRSVPRRQSRKADAPPTPDMPPRRQMREQRQQARDLFIALTLTGGRWTEIRSLTADQVQGGDVMLWGYKTQEPRLVPCPPVMAEALERRRQIAAATGSVYLFPGLASDKPQKWSGAIRRAFNRAGVNAPHLVARHGRATIHSLRHTFASWLIRDGMSLAEVQTLLGHTTLQMTRRYAHLGAAETVAKAADKLAGKTSALMSPPSEAVET